jgi:hypothetical protein
MAEEREDYCGNNGLYNEWQEAGKECSRLKESCEKIVQWKVTTAKYLNM